MHGVDDDLKAWQNVAHAPYERQTALAVEVEVGYHDVHVAGGACLFGLLQAGSVHDLGIGKR